MKKLNTRQIALNGIVAGLYAAITILTASFAYGNIQFRISEALMMLLLFEPSLTVGLTIGCLIANLFSTVSVLDIVIGTAATLLACLLTTRIKKPALAPLPTILVNAVMVGAMLSWLYMPSEQFWYGLLVFGGEVGAGEAAVLYVLGLPLYYAMKKTDFIHKLLYRLAKYIYIPYISIFTVVGDVSDQIICLFLGAIGIANMWMAIFADVGVMVIAVLNAIRALYVKNL